jgi:flavodoxin
MAYPNHIDMKNLMITYLSKTGITKKYAEEINDYVKGKGLKTDVVSIKELDAGRLKNADGILFGAWTSGLMIFLQHPDKPWVKFAKGLPDLKDKQVGLFTTYKLATGSMFKKMKKQLEDKITENRIELKSKNGSLSDQDKMLLDQFIK